MRASYFLGIFLGCIIVDVYVIENIRISTHMQNGDLRRRLVSTPRNRLCQRLQGMWIVFLIDEPIEI